jgi:predicted permease
LRYNTVKSCFFSKVFGEPLTPQPLSPKGARGELSSGLVAAMGRAAVRRGLTAQRPFQRWLPLFQEETITERIGEIYRKLAFFFRRTQFHRDLEEEMSEHLRLKAKALVEDGIRSEEARNAARRDFGNPLLLRERSRDAWGFACLDTLFQDVRYGLRQLRRNPGFTAVAIITLALGIGANTAIFSIVDAVMLRPLPYQHADRLTVIFLSDAKHRKSGEIFDYYGEFQEWKRYSHSFERLAVASWGQDAGAVLSWRGEKREILAIPASLDFFSLLGAHAAQGRTFEAEDLKNPCTVVLSHAFWQEQLGGTPGWVGKSLILSGAACTIAGVMPRDFSFYPGSTQLWTLITPDGAFAKHPWKMPVGVFGLLKPGVSRASAQAELTALDNRIIGENPSLAAMKVEPDVLDLQREFTWLTGRNLRSSLTILFAAVVFVLLIACVNVANLLLGRASERQKELGVRAALGSGRSRLIRQLLTESVVLSAGGAFLGTLVAIFCLRYINATEATQLPPGNPVTVSWQVLAFTAVVAILTGILFGLVPAWKASRLDLNEVLKESGRTASRGAFSRRASRVLAIAEIAFSLALLAGASLLIESVVRLANAPLGYERDRLLTADLRLPPSSYPKPTDWMRFYDRLGRRIASLPGVTGAAFSPEFPIGAGDNPVTIEGHGSEPSVTSYTVSEQPASAGYFQVMGIPLFRGREFDDRDRKKSLPVAIVDQSFVREVFPKGNPLGQRIKLGGQNSNKPWLTIVGVVGSVKRFTVFKEMGTEGGPLVYVPLRQQPVSTLSVFVRTAAKPRSVESSVGRAVTITDGNLPRPDIETQDQWLAQWTAQPEFRAVLLGIFAALALLLASVGIYGVLSQFVSQRTHEIGVRVALGARRRDVLGLIVGEGFKLIITGIAVGLAGALALTRFLASLLYGVGPADPLTFFLVSLTLVGVALLACYVPARRAAKVDPMVALRYE